MMPESNRPISVEDLLRLKRAERPPAEFWATFDRELRAKQLAALVGKRPWWQTLPKVWSGLSHYRLPLGASAIVAVTFFSVRDHQATTPAQLASDHAVPVAVAAVAEQAMPVEHSSFAAASAEAAATGAEGLAHPVGENVFALGSDASPEAAPPHVLSVSRPVAADELPAVHVPSGLHIATSLVSLQASDRAARSLLDGSTGFEARAMPVRVAVEPLQQMTPPSETRRSRLLTAMVSTAAMESSMRTTERAASRIDEERLYDQIHRFGARGDRVQMKF